MPGVTHSIVICACEGCPAVGQRPLGFLPSDISLVRLACARAFEPVRVLELLLARADGVLVVGCVEGTRLVSDYEIGEKLKVLQRLMHQLGFAPERVATAWVARGEVGQPQIAVEKFRAALGWRHWEVRS